MPTSVTERLVEGIAEDVLRGSGRVPFVVMVEAAEVRKGKRRKHRCR
jgi:hypothetical protein